MEREFRFFKLSEPSRLVLAGVVFLAGGALQLVTGTAFPGALLMLLGWAPLLLRPATNRPDDQGLEEWRPVTVAELDRLDDAIRDSKKLRKKLRSGPVGCLVAFVLPFILVLGLGFGLFKGEDFGFLIANALVLLVPPFFMGWVKIFVPATIDRKIPSFRAILAAAPPPGVSFVPYFRFDKDPEGRDIPEDLRLMLESKRRPADLVGIQLQAAINKGPNGEVPYLYAVVLCRGTQGAAYAAARSIRHRGYEIEAGGEGEYGTVVIRQATSGGGYHTTPDDCRELAQLCYRFLETQ